MSRQTLALAVAAVLGIAITAVLAWSASQLAGQRIGLSSQPLSVAHGLAPAREGPTERHEPGGKHEPTRERTGTRPRQTSGTATLPQSGTAPARIAPSAGDDGQGGGPDD